MTYIKNPIFSEEVEEDSCNPTSAPDVEKVDSIVICDSGASGLLSIVNTKKCKFITLFCTLLNVS